MNIIKSLEARIEERLKETKQPCKTYATYETADTKGAEVAQIMANHFDTRQPADWVVVAVIIDEKIRYTPCFNLTGLLARPEAKDGYLGIADGFYTF